MCLSYINLCGNRIQINASQKIFQYMSHVKGIIKCLGKKKITGYFLNVSNIVLALK